ncbi:hypothetical protein FB451DRAFT_1126756 [Mycena latifolia]|nr:hypothetical protein FB451DRAFT_1126756 [Mycena latifolia]
MDAANPSPAIAPENATRVQDLWFPDHGLILQAGNRLFRVPGGILAARSSVFKDMLSISQPQSQPQIDECPLVILHDSAIDAEYFLKAIFDSSFFERPPARSTFAIVAGVLRLSTKYDVEFLRQRALLHLSTAIPGSLAAYDIHSSPITMESPGNEFSCLLLVHSLALTWAMPAAMYAVSCCTVEEIIDGILSDGGHVQLPSSLQRACLIARSTLAIKQHHDIFRFLRSDPIQGCLSRESCQQMRHAVLHRYTRLIHVDPLEFGHPSLSPVIRNGLCGPCTEAAESDQRVARHAIWDSLPALFDLPPWDELNASRAADLNLD